LNNGLKAMKSGWSIAASSCEDADAKPRALSRRGTLHDLTRCQVDQLALPVFSPGVFPWL